MREVVTREWQGAGQDTKSSLRFRRLQAASLGAVAAVAVSALVVSWPKGRTVEQIETAIEHEQRRMGADAWEETEGCTLTLGREERRWCAKIVALRKELDGLEVQPPAGAARDSLLGNMLLLGGCLAFWGGVVWVAWRMALRGEPQPLPSPLKTEAPAGVEVVVVHVRDELPPMIDITPVKVEQIEHHPEYAKEFDRWADGKFTKA
jgi:hypothetical protein